MFMVYAASPVVNPPPVVSATMLHSHCSYCGTAYPPDAAWPRLCAGCGETTWRNPLPVAVILLPVDDHADGHGLVVVRRGIEPGYGQLALPGGYIEIGESWREAAVRELHEETGLTADADDVTLFDVHSATHGTLMVCGLLPARSARELPPSAPTDETLEWLVITEPRQLAFPVLTRLMADYFASA
jgi:8-oxo-dGTP diphosphatase